MLKQADREIEKEAEKYLEMPPIMEEREDSNTVLEKRPELDGYSECNIVFTDISQGTTNRVIDNCIYSNPKSHYIGRMPLRYLLTICRNCEEYE